MPCKTKQFGKGGRKAVVPSCVKLRRIGGYVVCWTLRTGGRGQNTRNCRRRGVGSSLKAIALLFVPSSASPGCSLIPSVKVRSLIW